ncbi:MAG TPA: sugar ABC transporter ATP-binding protein [Candidatus Sulfopaludibacter sp.]|nr:sugar ABC transporter ATP-binding protein [Candidatus Sulfopaludibacter sp.]
MLRVDSVSKSFGGIQALDRVDLSVEAGTVHAVTGENGAGKSTLMRIIAGLERPDSGEVRFSGSAIAMIHQELQVFPALSVSENIFMGDEPSRFGWIDRRARDRQARELLGQLGLSLDTSRPMGELTVAEQQSVEIAKAMRRAADLIIMDEPTSALSERESELLFEMIGGLKRRGAAILYISHRMPEIFRLADTITVMRDGRHVATEPASAFDESRLIALMVGRSLDHGITRTPAPPGETILEVRGLGRPPHFRGVSFQLRRGEILGLAGLLGAGRTDVAAAIYGLAPATEGEVVLRGQRTRIASPAAALAQGIAMVTEDRKKFGFVPEMSIQENVTLSCLGRYSWGPVIRGRGEAAAADEQIRRFSVRTAGRDQHVKDLSGGNQQKVALARALLTDPDILILDEPTRGIDVGAKAEIYALIDGLARQGKAILLVSSEMSEILGLCNRILVMREGMVVAGLTPSATTSEAILRLAMPL